MACFVFGRCSWDHISPTLVLNSEAWSQPLDCQEILQILVSILSRYILSETLSGSNYDYIMIILFIHLISSFWTPSMHQPLVNALGI